MPTAVPPVDAAEARSPVRSLLTYSLPPLNLPYPETLPSRRSELVTAVRAVGAGRGLLAAFGEPAARAGLRLRLSERPAPDPDVRSGLRAGRWEGLRSLPVSPPSPQAHAEQDEHDRYFAVQRTGDDVERDFVAGLLLAHLSAYENCLAMGVTLLDQPEWYRLFAGLRGLARFVEGEDAPSPGGSAQDEPPPQPSPSGWRDGYNPAARWLIGHQLFFALIQGAIVGLNCFASATADASGDREQGLALSAAFLRSSAAAMKLTSDFDPADYDATVRPAMSPPRVREGFSGLQTRDHACLIRLFGALKPTLTALAGRVGVHEELVDSVISAYAAHEYICARFRGDVLPSLRMAATTHGKTKRPGTEVIREMMRARLALIAPAAPSGPPATAPGEADPLGPEPRTGRPS